MWVRLPKGYGISDANGRIMKLQKSLYELRHAPKLRYSQLARTIEKISFRRSQLCECLLIGGGCNATAYLVTYVDDVILAGARAAVTMVKAKLSRVLTVTDLEKFQNFIGMHTIYRPNGVLPCQSEYTERVLASAEMKDTKPAETLLHLKHTLYRARTPKSEEDHSTMSLVPFRNVLGSLIYLSVRTRPNIATAVSSLARFQVDPTSNDWKALKHLLKDISRIFSSGSSVPRTLTTRDLLPTAMPTGGVTKVRDDPAGALIYNTISQRPAECRSCKLLLTPRRPKRNSQRFLIVRGT